MPGATQERDDAQPRSTAGAGQEGLHETELLTPEEVAKRLRVTRRTVYTWLKLGRLRGLRAGKAWRIAPADLAAFLMPPAAWEARLDRSLALVQSQVPADLPDDEISAAIEAARDAVHREKRARGH